MARPARILVVGPPGLSAERVYGGGTGGYTRNMSVYLATLGGKALDLTAFHHSVRGQYRGFGNLGLVRMVRDTTGFLFTCLSKRPDAVHVLAQYRGALVREYGQALICRMLRIPFVYDVKAGAFAKSLELGSPRYRSMLGRLIAATDLLFAEGKKTQEVLKATYGREAVYFPNFVPVDEVPDAVPERLAQDVIRVLFVGYCYREKGVFELVEGTRQAARAGVALELDLIGAESPEFTAWIDALPDQDGLAVHRHGKRPHGDVLAAMKKSDVYAYPTCHPGEGHNNSINEAMMHGLVILTTRQGFLGDVLGDGCAYFLDEVSPDAIAAMIGKIFSDRIAAQQAAHDARQRLLRDFTDTAARARFQAAYLCLLNQDVSPNSGLAE